MTTIKKVIILLILYSCVFIINAEAGDKLIIVGEKFAPYKFVENGRITGIDVEVAEYIFTKIGVDFEFKIKTWARCWHELKNGIADVGIAVSNKGTRKDYVYFPENHVWDADYLFLTHTDFKAETDVRGLEDAVNKKLKVGVIRGNSYHEKFWAVFPDTAKGEYNKALDPAAGVVQCLKKLSAKRIDVYPIVKTIGLYTARQLGLSNITYYDTVLFSKPYPNCFSKQSSFKSDNFPDIASVMKAYDRELGVFKKTAEFREIISKYE
jgi:polar amino acid transport system substrate-binding protein